MCQGPRPVAAGAGVTDSAHLAECVSNPGMTEQKGFDLVAVPFEHPAERVKVRIPRGRRPAGPS